MTQESSTLASKFYTVLPRTLELFGQMLSSRARNFFIRCDIDIETEAVTVSLEESDPGNWTYALDEMIRGLDLFHDLGGKLLVVIGHHIALQLFREGWLRYEDFLSAQEKYASIILSKPWPVTENGPENALVTVKLLITPSENLSGEEQGASIYSSSGELLVQFLVTGNKHITLVYEAEAESQ